MKSYHLILFFIVIIAFILRFYNLEHIPPGIHGDEAEFGLIQQKINRGSYDTFFSLGDTGSIFGFSVLSFWTQGLFQTIFGENVFGIRASSTFIGTITVIFFFFLAKLFFKNIFIALLLTLTFATSHYHIAYSRMTINDIWTTFFSVAVFYFLYRSFSTKGLGNFILSGIFLGLSLYFAQSTTAIPVIAIAGGIVHLFTSRFTSKKLKSNIKHLAFLFGVAILVFAPQSIYFFQHPEALSSRMDTVSVFNHLPGHYARYHVNNVFGVLLWQFINTLKLFHFGGDIGFYFYGYQGSFLAPIVGIFAFVGFIICFIKRKERHLFFLIWFFTIVLLGGTITIDAPSSQRLVGIIPALFLFAGVTLEQLIKYKTHYLKIILIILFIINGIWDYKIYFRDYINSQAGWAQREPATQIAYYLKTLGPNWKVYMLRENSLLYFHHGTIRFINPNLEGMDVDNSESQIPIAQPTNKNIVYIMLPNSPSIYRIKQFYPKGKERHFFNPIGNTPSFSSYEIDNVNLIR